MALVFAERRRSLLDSWFGIDLRSLAVFRIAVASALLWDVTDRFGDRAALYTNAGVLPTDLLLALWGKGAYLSPYFHASDYPSAVFALFAIQAGAAIALGLGWRTRWVGLLSWFLLVSLQVRNPFAAGEGCDKFLAQILLIGLLLPMGAKWSLDARHRATPLTHTRTLSAASAASILQVCLLYWVTGWLKTGDSWSNGTAVWMALHLDYWALPFGVWLREFEEFTALATYGTLWFERLGPLIAFVPIWIGPVRTCLVAAFIVFHLSLASALSVGPFPFYSLVAWPVLLPTWFWDEFLPWLRKRARGVTDFDPQTLRPGFPTQAAASFLLVLMALQSADRLHLIPESVAKPIRAVVHPIGRTLRFSQNWRMFSPDPPNVDPWPVIRGYLADGSQVDPLTGEPTMTAKPALLSTALPSFRWRVYYAFLMYSANNPSRGRELHRGLSEFFCSSWNKDHSGGQTLQRLDIENWIEYTDRRTAPITRVLVYEYDCRTQVGELYPRRK